MQNSCEGFMFLLKTHVEGTTHVIGYLSNEKHGLYSVEQDIFTISELVKTQFLYKVPIVVSK